MRRRGEDATSAAAGLYQPASALEAGAGEAQGRTVVCRALLPAHQQRLEAIRPATRAIQHSAPRALLSPAFGHRLVAAGALMRREPQGRELRVDFAAVVTPVRTRPLGCARVRRSGRVPIPRVAMARIDPMVEP